LVRALRNSQRAVGTLHRRPKRRLVQFDERLPGSNGLSARHQDLSDKASGGSTQRRRVPGTGDYSSNRAERFGKCLWSDGYYGRRNGRMRRRLLGGVLFLVAGGGENHSGEGKANERGAHDGASTHGWGFDDGTIASMRSSAV